MKGLEKEGMAMKDAAQKVLTANQQAAAGPPSPEQQMVLNDQKRLEMEGRKLDMQALKDQLQNTLDMMKLKLEEKKLAVNAYEAGAEGLARFENAEKDRELEKFLEISKMVMNMVESTERLNFEKGKEVLNRLENENEKGQ